MAAKNATKTQNKVVEYSTMECSQALAPGWRMPLARLEYYRDKGVMSCRSIAEVTFGVAAKAEGLMVAPVVGRKNMFVVGNDLPQLLKAAGVTDEVQYIDIWQTQDVNDVWQTTDKVRRRITGVAQRYYPGEDWGDFKREMSHSIAVLARDVEKYGLHPSDVMEIAEEARPVSKGCQMARAARERQAERVANSKKPAGWQEGVGAPASSPSLLDLDGRIFAGALAGTL